MTATLTRILPWGHHLVRDVASSGDLVVDLTAGNGKDTLLLFETVGSLGRVLAFDIQPQALAATRQRLVPMGARLVTLEPGQTLPAEPGVYLTQQCHSRLQKVLDVSPRAVVANLGYLPGGDQRVITQAETTLSALQQAAELLAVGGRLVVAVYTGHEGALAEGRAVDQFFSDLPKERWQTLNIHVPNQNDAPYLMAAQKRF